MKKDSIKIFFLQTVLVFLVLTHPNHLLANIPQPVDEEAPAAIVSDSVFKSYLDSQDIRITHLNKVEIIRSGHDKFIRLFEDIRQAKHYIHLEYFNFRNDSIANALFDLLGQKVKEGVKVRAMFDAFGNMSNNRPLKKKHLKEIRANGIEIVKFDPIRFPYINHVWQRDHRKIVVIDGTIGYTGGMNIADYYINGLPEIGEWRDMHVRIEGEAVHQLQDIFLTMWKKETKEVLTDSLLLYPQTTVLDSTEIAIVDRAPRKTPKAIRRAYIKAINAAQHKIQLINPYFTPIHSIQKALRDALKRGVKVEIMIPGKSDIPFTPDAAFYIANNLRKRGADIYIFNGGFHHSKIMMIDDKFCTVGSANLNSRSLRYDYEVNAFIFDQEPTDELIDIFTEDQKNSTILTKEEYKKRSSWRRFVGWFAHLLVPFI